MADIKLTIGGTTKSLNLIKQEGRKAWQVSEIPRVLARGTASEVSYASLAADRELIFEQDNWVGGFGQGNFEDADKYADGSNIDTSLEDKIILGPAIGGGVGSDSYPILGFKVFAGGLYCWTSHKVFQITSVATTPALTQKKSADFGNAWVANTAYTVGQYVTPTAGKLNGFIYECYSIAGTGTSAATEPTWPATINGTVIDNPGANQITWIACQIRQLEVWGTRCFIAISYAKYVYTGDFATFVCSTLTQDSMDGFLSAPSAVGTNAVLWGFKQSNFVYASDNPINGGTQWTSYIVGDSSAGITKLMLSADRLLVGREDNLYHLDTDSTVHPLMDELKTVLSADNFKYFTYWKTSLYFSLGGSKIGEITTSDSFRIIGPYQDIKELDLRGTIYGLTSDRDFLYVIIGDGTNFFCYKGREITRNGILRWEWYPFLKESATYGNPGAAIVFYWTATSNPILLFGRPPGEGSVYALGRVILSDNPLADSTYKFTATGSLTTGWFDANFRGWDKLLQLVNCECSGWDVNAGTHSVSLSANVKVVISYEKDDSGSFTAIDTAYTANNKSLATKKYLDTADSYKKVRFKIDLYSNDNTITPLVKFFSANGHLKPEYTKLFDFTVYVGDTRSSLAKTIRDFLLTGRTSTSLISLYDRFSASTTTLSDYIIFLPGYPEEVEIFDEETKQITLAMHIMAIKVDWVA